MKKRTLAYILLTLLCFIQLPSYALIIKNLAQEESLSALLTDASTSLKLDEKLISPQNTLIFNNAKIVNISLYYSLPLQTQEILSINANQRNCTIEVLPTVCKFWEFWCSETKPKIQNILNCNTQSL